MANITCFSIKNFKGIENLQINIAKRHICPVVTLVGLNESGKTTILEAIAQFPTEERNISGINDAIDYHSFIPVSQQGNFNDEIIISGEITLDQSDIDCIEKIFQTSNLILDTKRLKDSFTISRTIKYKDSIKHDSVNYWDIDFYVKEHSDLDYARFQRSNDQEKSDLWMEVVDYIETTLPSISYFPNFLVEIPEKIYLTSVPGEQESQIYYREVIQDILNHMGGDLEIQTHIVDRILDFQKTNDDSKRKMVSAVVRSIADEISREVIGSWENIFGRKIFANSINLDWSIDPQKNNAPYITISISDGQSFYSIHQRSLGFRWFFFFLLFTRYKQGENRRCLFLFDEPAANLHARAQTELLRSFDKIIASDNGIIYSTHSAHMINPSWLPAAHIVENTSINHDSDEETTIYATPPTAIAVYPYRQFVGEYPARESYFQPIVEKLDYVAPMISPNCSVIVTEGISDFHAMNYYCSDLLREKNVQLIPGIGDTQHDFQIAQLIGRGQRFIIVLDDDASGKAGAERYREKWILSTKEVSTYGELHSASTGKKFEQLLSTDTRNNICNHFSKPNGNPTKKEIAMYFSEANAGNIQTKSSDTQTTIQEIVEAAVNELI